MNVLFAYNFDDADIADGDYDRLYAERRRDATFAAAYETDEALYALRDHLGIVPLYYRFTPTGVRFSASMSDLVEPGDKLNHEGLSVYLKFGTPRLMPLIEGIHSVPAGSVIRITDADAEPDIVYT